MDIGQQRCGLSAALSQVTKEGQTDSVSDQDRVLGVCWGNQLLLIPLSKLLNLLSVHAFSSSFLNIQWQKGQWSFSFKELCF